MSILETQNLTHVYSRGTPFEKVAVDNVSLSVDEGELLGIIGHTGSGKSTFIQHLNGLLKPTAGKVLFQGRDIHASKDALRAVRFGVGLVFQYPEYQLFEETVFQDVSFGPKNMGLGEDEIRERVYEAAAFVGVGRELMEVSPLELSGGQKRRVAIAGVIAMRPRVLILDEPTAGLDPAGRESILENISQFQRETGAAVVLISHSMDDIARFAQRLIVLHEGRLVMDGTPAQVFDRANELKDMGLTVPMATEIALALRARGVELPESVYTTKYLRKLLTALREGGGPC
ncbi:MAG: energy-coupling factor transporter ATPase [Oscillospiraceae bacterium]|nr:energy-coupling factor transporter ATPase [Oscillospiraceae bacterium]